MENEIEVKSEQVEETARESESTDLALAPPLKAHLVARTAIEMGSAQADMARWLTQKIAYIDAEITEVETAKAEAQLHKWKTSTFSSVLSKARTRRTFYEKVLGAVQAGYTVVPNFPIDVFAIRVERESPVNGEEIGRWQNPADWRAEKPDVLDAGEGRYVSVKPKGNRWVTEQKDSAGTVTKVHHFMPTDFTEAEFPVMAAHPTIMEATARARDLNLFDQIGICPPMRKRGKGDPLIIGQIVETMPKWGDPPRLVSFLIAWYLDLRTL